MPQEVGPSEQVREARGSELANRRRTVEQEKFDETCGGKMPRFIQVEMIFERTANLKHAAYVEQMKTMMDLLTESLTN